MAGCTAAVMASFPGFEIGVGVSQPLDNCYSWSPASSVFKFPSNLLQPINDSWVGL